MTFTESQSEAMLAACIVAENVAVIMLNWCGVRGGGPGSAHDLYFCGQRAQHLSLRVRIGLPTRVLSDESDRAGAALFV